MIFDEKVFVLEVGVGVDDDGVVCVDEVDGDVL